MARPTVRAALPVYTGPAWTHAYSYDANSNRTAFLAETPGNAAVYGTARYGQNTYTPPNPAWEVPAPGYDAANRMPAFNDRQANQTGFEYDVEGRRTRITYPFPAVDPVQTTAAYDMVGRLLELKTSQGSTDLLSLTYGYDRASNRISMVANSDTFDYK